MSIFDKLFPNIYLICIYNYNYVCIYNYNYIYISDIYIFENEKWKVFVKWRTFPIRVLKECLTDKMKVEFSSGSVVLETIMSQKVLCLCILLLMQILKIKAKKKKKKEQCIHLMNFYWQWHPRARGRRYGTKHAQVKHLDATLPLSADEEDMSMLTILRSLGRARSLVLGTESCPSKSSRVDCLEISRVASV